MVFQGLLEHCIHSMFPQSFLLEITLTNIYLDLNALFMPRIPKCKVEYAKAELNTNNLGVSTHANNLHGGQSAVKFDA
jgi:hypothetical protein